ncbi:MAG TPA: GTP cyclohydrolase I FolE2 [Thermotogaceae bacterium]|nr:GTP cyclohydrolase I FolE2 [Thermotogota bacterium]HEW91021.1 GTP cyclohydrolase I FolE2 [Thermotogaceae bacterium]
MKDIQSERDNRNIPINKVGVEGVSYPIVVMDKSKKHQETVGKITMSVDLPKDFRGTHMSRFIEVLNRHRSKINPHNIEDMLEDIRKVLRAQTAHIEIEFPYFIEKKAPVSKIKSYMKYNCKFSASKTSDKFDFVITVEIPIQTVCPCSLEISDFGAHNQRALVKISVRMRNLVWIEELIEVAENAASSPVYTLLKREDEKYVTENSFMNPRFVEDVAREVVKKLKNDPRITWYKVEVLSYESIHNHNAFACIES